MCDSERPNTKALGISVWGSSVSRSMLRTLRRRRSKKIWISSRASAAPRQKWVPKPKAMWWLGLRVMSKDSGFSK